MGFLFGLFVLICFLATKRSAWCLPGLRRFASDLFHSVALQLCECASCVHRWCMLRSCVFSLFPV